MPSDLPELAGASTTVEGSYCAFPAVPSVSDDVARAGHWATAVTMLAANAAPGTPGIVPDAEVSAGDDDGAKCEKSDGARGEFCNSDLPSDSPDDFLAGAEIFAAWNAVRDGANIIVYAGIEVDVFG